MNTSSTVASQILRGIGADVVPFVNADPGEWDSLVDRSDEGWVYHRYGWVRWAATFTQTNFSFALADATGRLVGVLPLYEDRPSANRLFRITRLGTGVSGPATAQDLAKDSRRSVWRRLVDVADQVSRARDAVTLEVRCSMSAEAYWPDRSDHRSLREVGLTTPIGGDPFRPHAVLDRFIDVSAPDEALLADMHQNARSAIRQSLRSGLVLDEATTAADVRRYHALHTASWTRTGLAPHPLEYFETMWSLLRPFGAMRVFFARHDERDVAAVLLHTYKRAAFYWGGCSLSEHQRLRPNNFLLWEAMRALRASGSRWFELGTYEPDGPPTKANSVGKFKASFGSISVVPLEAQRTYRPAPLLLASAMRELKLAAATLIRRWQRRGVPPR
jgi:GNAT acetyltransferase-like protein